MKLVELQIEGYRSFKEAVWRPYQLNVVIGPNAGGKSNLLRCLHLLSALGGKRLSKFIQDEGGFKAAIWDGRAERMAFSTKFVADMRALDYMVAMQPIGRFGRYEVVDERAEQTEPTGASWECMTRTAKSLGYRDGPGELLCSSHELDPEEPALPLFAPESLSMGDIGHQPHLAALSRSLAGWLILQDFASHADAPVRAANVVRYEKRLSHDASNLVGFLHTNYTEDARFKDAIDRGMGAAFLGEFADLLFAPASDERIQLAIKWRSLRRRTSAAEISDGTLRFLLLIGAFSQSDPPDLIAIDEPETGLHPGMLAIVAEYAISAARRSQIILTTHSPELLDAFPKEEPPTVTVCTAEDGATKLTTKTGDELREWLREFSLGELHRGGGLEAMT